MQIKKKQHPSTSPALAATRRDARVAREHATLFPARLALARWTRGGDIPHVFAVCNQPPRAGWFARVQGGFQAWLEAGGFHQETAPAAVVGPVAGPVAAPCRAGAGPQDDDGLHCPLPGVDAK